MGGMGVCGTAVHGGKRGWRCVGRQEEKKSVHKSDLFCVALTGGGVDARAAAVPPPPPPPARLARRVVEETKWPS